MRLSDLIGENGRADAIEIHGLTADSRTVRPGFLFAALPGTRADGSRFIEDAIRQGAAAVLARPDVAVPHPKVFVVADENPRRRLALLAAKFYDRQPGTVVAVTGTNGKTSTAHFAAQIWNRLGRRAGSVGTLGVIVEGRAIDSSLTTPEPVSLHRTLHDLAAEGFDHLAIEASSHGLDQFRLDGVRIAAGAFTNITHDHLDYHPTFAAYLAAKLRLFEIMAPRGTAVINADLPETRTVVAAARRHGLQVVTYGHAAGADYRIADLHADGRGQAFSLHVQGTAHAVRLPVFGSFQAANAIAALALVVATGVPFDQARDALAQLAGVPGRMQRIGAPTAPVSVFVDYAHTPDALATVLRGLRPHARRRLAVVFGCGGDRDPSKRTPMGHIACELADEVTVTDDNPRSENADRIRAAILLGCPQAREVGDRAAAIQAAVAGLNPGDVLVIAGKGHEQGQIVGGEIRPFDDASVARAALAQRGWA
jgi:UDP-N-acetylmuramoyl-L-alanyl-D-glutamate--2,6-diaminopimelate ligase